MDFERPGGLGTEEKAQWPKLLEKQVQGARP